MGKGNLRVIHERLDKLEENVNAIISVLIQAGIVKVPNPPPIAEVLEKQLEAGS